MDHSLLHILEFVTLILGGGAVAVRLIPPLKEAVIFFQIALYLTQLFGFYIRRNPDKRKALQHFVTGMLDHYLKTHPEGQAIAQSTDLDEKVAAFYRRESRVKEDYVKQLCKLLGVKVDNS